MKNIQPPSESAPNQYGKNYKNVTTKTLFDHLIAQNQIMKIFGILQKRNVLKL